MRTSDTLTIRQRRVLYRAWHRGIREMDLILGRFADAKIAQFDEAALDEFEQFMELPDKELFAWISGAVPVPTNQDTPLYRAVVQFHSAQTDTPAQ